MKVTLRKKPLTKNRHRLILDYYPMLLNPLTNAKTDYENLKLYFFDNPSTPIERKHNQETLTLAEGICAQRQLDIQVQVHGLIPNHFKQRSFIDYFRHLANRQRGVNRHNWDSSVRYFQLFRATDIKFAEINLSLCEDFKAFLLNAPQLRELRRGIGHNSALSYFNKFRTALKQVWREKLIDDTWALIVETLYIFFSLNITNSGILLRR